MGTESANRHKREEKQLCKPHNTLEDGISPMDSHRWRCQRTAWIFRMGNSNRQASIMGRKRTGTEQPGVAGITLSRKHSTASGR
eukprot:13113183-Ditylum_brightwellii.AAC.1